MNGVLIIDKPAGLTSHDVVNRVRRILGQRSIGHLGTLDPMATGVLPLVTGSFTRLAQFYGDSEKAYEGTIRFGFSTDTYDLEGAPSSPPQSVALKKEEIEALAGKFRGLIKQMPPPFSAKKIKGVPAYKLARKQKEVILQPVQVEIREFEILSCESDRATFRARVTSGTYVRSVAHDIGQLLACGAHLESLRRTAVAEFTLADAHSLEELAEAAGKSSNSGRTGGAFGRETVDGLLDESSREAATALSPRRKPWVAEVEIQAPEGRKNAADPTSHGALPLDALFIHPRKLLPNFPCVTADEATTARIRAGRPVNLPELSRARQVKVFAGQRDLLAIATRIAGTLFHPKMVLAS